MSCATSRAVAIQRRDDTLGLLLRVVRAPSGIYVVFAAQQDQKFKRGVFNPHSSWHRDGRVHNKSFDQARQREQRQRLDAFTGAEHFVRTGWPEGRARLLPSCDVTQFSTTMVVPEATIDDAPTGAQIQVDLIAPGGTFPTPMFGRLAECKTFDDDVPFIVVSVYQMDLRARCKHAI
jgi:hypothetical protein